VKNLLRRVRQRYLDLSLSKKIYIPNFIIILILILLSGFIATRVVSDIMLERIIGNTRQSLDIIIQSLDNVLNDIETGAARVAGDPVVQSILSKSNSSGEHEGLDNYFLVRSILAKILYQKNFVDSISAYRLDGTLVGSGSLNYGKEPNKAPLSTELVRMVTEAKGKSLWIDPRTLMYSAVNSSSSGVTMFRTVLKGNVGEVIGIIKVDLNESIFSKLYSHLDYGKTGRFLVANRQGVMIFPETKDYGLYTEFLRNQYYEWFKSYDLKGTVHTFGKERFVVISNFLERLGWVIIGIVPLNELMDYSQRITLFIYLIGFVCILLEIAFAFSISRAVSKPIKELSDSMEDAAHGDLQIRVAVRGEDEIGRLSRTFNEMVERIAGLVDLVYVEQKHQRELELVALQSQIHPHFLYNSLESICALAQLERNEDAYKLGKSLSMFYRGVLSGGKPVVEIRDEVNIIRHYLTIQGLRYKDKFDVHLDVDDAILPAKIVKLSLQPIVENSIYHGLKNVRRKGKIWIRGLLEGDGLIRISVMDNGIGMESGQAASILSRTASGAGGKGFGLSSVDQRIKLCFGEQYGLTVESRAGYWTKVHVRLPSTIE